MKKVLKIVGIVLEAIILTLALVGGSLLKWFRIHFGVTFREIIYTFASPMKGANLDPVSDAVRFCAAAIISTVVIFIIFILAVKLSRKMKINLNIRLFKLRARINILAAFLVLTVIASVLACASVLYNAEQELRMVEFIQDLAQETHIYDDYYVWPDVNAIQSDAPKNLIYIYIESMESTFADKESGGLEDINYIPHLTQLAKDNINFSADDKVGGFNALPGTGWTAAGLFASATGIPFSYPVEGNADMGQRENYAKNLITLGDILEDKGYYQEFLCGSNGDFAGRKSLYTQHGDFFVLDYNECIRQGYIDEGYYVSWGFEDVKLYDIARKELSRITSEHDGPFNFSMLTVDTHFPSGFLCELCDDKYPERFANVLGCADSQLYDFVSWCQEQDWYDDTVIVIQGDHLSMGTDLVEDFTKPERSVYNCFINTGIDPAEVPIKNRMFSVMDMYPTTLHALGFNIPGDRVGLGTDLFSDTPTLMEELGFDYLDGEFRKYSSYYIENFS